MSTTVLSIDGGGMKGIISAIVLMELEKQIKLITGNPKVYLSDYFDLIAGTSTGSILAALLLCPNEHNQPRYTAADALSLYVSKGKNMFQTNLARKIRTMNGLLGPKYNNKNLKHELDTFFGTIKTADLIKPCLLPSYNMDTREPIFFNSLSSLKEEDRNYQLSDAVLASTAAPTYFPPTCTKAYSECIDCLIDGGVYANNPSLCALIEALKLKNVKSLNDTMLLSIGNVNNSLNYNYDSVKHWGTIKWAFPILDVLMDASEQTVDYQLEKLYSILKVPNHYLRIVAHVKKDVPDMDCTSEKSINRLMDIGKELAHKKQRELKAYAKMLVDNHSKKLH